MGEMTKFEVAALREIARHLARSPYYWREASMHKLVARGYVERYHPAGFPEGWRITNAGRAALIDPAPPVARGDEVTEEMG